MDKSSIEWTEATCRSCRVMLTTENRVEPGRLLCKKCKNKRMRLAYIPKGPPGRRGWLVPTRDGDKKQARRRINYLVEQGLIPRPDDLPCMDCADEIFSKQSRHEYDHARGYDSENQLYVEPVCARCHRQRGEAHCVN